MPNVCTHCTYAEAANGENLCMVLHNHCLMTNSIGKVMIEEEMKEEIKEEMETHAGPEEGKFVTLLCNEIKKNNCISEKLMLKCKYHMQCIL